MARSYLVQSGSTVVVPVEVTTAADPTGSAVAFSFTAASATDAGSFTSGSWAGSVDASTGKATALSPTLPAAGATLELAEGRWATWVRFTVGSETVVLPAGVMVVG